MELNPPQRFINFNQELVEIPLSHMLSVLPGEVVAHSVLLKLLPSVACKMSMSRPVSRRPASLSPSVKFV